MKILKYIFILVVLSLVIFLVLQTKTVNKTDTVSPQNVENYLRENISKLSPVKAVLGGTWYVVSITTDLEKNSGTVTYEDGHIQEIKNFLYTANDKGEIVSLTIIDSPVVTVPVACTMEAKICPDGSAVGRQGPSCAFAACPTVATTSVAIPVNKNIILTVGQKLKVGDLNVTLNSIVQDSRCPIDVTCIQAGSVNVNVTLADSTHYTTKNFASNEASYTFGKYHISIVDVAPTRQSQKEILPSQYRITFHVTD